MALAVAGEWLAGVRMERVKVFVRGHAEEVVEGGHGGRLMDWI